VNITEHPIINDVYWRADRYQLVSHPGSHFEVWVYRGPDLVLALSFRLGDTIWFVSRKSHRDHRGKLLRVTPQLGYVLDPWNGETRHLELRRLAWSNITKSLGPPHI
jgi:hypothetical protein